MIARREVLLSAALLPAAVLPTWATDIAPTGTLDDFDFLEGRWTVEHEALVDDRWQKYAGTCEAQSVLGGQANIDDNHWRGGSVDYRAMTVRVFDPKARRWSLFWVDARSPDTVGPPVVGGFAGTHGLFYGDDTLNGQPIRVRFDWHALDDRHCRWEQAYQVDAAKGWVPNWRMRFTRA